MSLDNHYNAQLQKDFLDLLQKYKSDDTKKARRNLSFISFIILSSKILNVRLADIKFFGLDLSKSSEILLLGLGLLLLAYWTVVFCVAYWRDKEIQKERVVLFDVHIENLKKHWATAQKHKGQSPNAVVLGYEQIQASFKRYQNQLARTDKATLLEKIINSMEFFIPLALMTISAFILFYELISKLFAA